jgi:hypothetical protein
VAEVSLEYLASQLQPHTGKILCVKDGAFLTSFDSTFKIPACLTLELIKPNKAVGTTEFHYRNTVTDEAWAFFDPRIYQWFQLGCRGIVRLDGSPTPDPVPARVTISEPPADLGEDLTGMKLSISTTSNPAPVDQIFVARFGR